LPKRWKAEGKGNGERVKKGESSSMLKAKMKILFVCSMNINRSRTAEDIFRERFETKSAGLYNPFPVTKEEIWWADLVMVMEDVHKDEIAKRFPQLYSQKKVISLGIPDFYNYMQPELVNILEARVNSLNIYDGNKNR